MAYHWRWARTALSNNSAGVTTVLGPRIRDEGATLCKSVFDTGQSPRRWRGTSAGGPRWRNYIFGEIRSGGWANNRSARQHIAPMWSMDMGLHSMCERVQNEYVRSFGCVGLGTEQRYGIKSKRAAGGCGTRQVREYTSAVGALGSIGTNIKTSVRTETAGLRLIHFLSGFWRKHFGMVTRRTIYRERKWTKESCHITCTVSHNTGNERTRF